MTTIKLSDPIARWLLAEAAHDVTRAYDSTPLHHCKFCDRPTPKCEQTSHLRAHKNEMKKVAAQRKRENAARLRAITRLRAEARR